MKNEKVILMVRAGAGGLEAQDWTHMLWRMYYCWATREGHDFCVATSSMDQFPRFMHATITRKRTILGPKPSLKRLLAGENGVHRLCRISPFDPERRRHTSFAIVSVLDEKDHTPAQRNVAFGMAKGNEDYLSWAQQVRSYVLHPYRKITDLRTGAESAAVEAVLDGELSAFLGKKKARTS